MTDIHDIKPVLIMGTDQFWLIWVLVFVSVVVLAGLAWRLWRRKIKTTTQTSQPLPAPEAEAYQQLDDLAAENGVEIKLFYYRLSAILRRYLERRFNIPAAEMTTEELLPQVDRLPLALDLAQPLKAFCRSADPIKFAGASASPSRMPGDLAFAREFVRCTTEATAAVQQDKP